MNEYYLSASFAGPNFYPSKFEGGFQGMTVDLSHDNGDVISGKSDADLTYDYGHLIIAVLNVLGRGGERP